MEDQLPGRELDAMVAEKVMGWVWHDASAYLPRRILPPDYDPINGSAPLPYYSTDDTCALQIINVLYDRGYDVNILYEHNQSRSQPRQVFLMKGDPEDWIGGGGNTLALAICLAALKCVTEEVAHGL